MNEFFKTSNKFITVNLSRKTMDKLNQEDSNALKKVHIVLFDYSLVDISCLKALVADCRSRGIRLIIDHFGYEDKKKLKAILRENGMVCDPLYFHFHNVRDSINFNVAPDYILRFFKNRLDIIKFGKISQSVVYYDEKSLSYQFRHWLKKKYRYANSDFGDIHHLIHRDPFFPNTNSFGQVYEYIKEKENGDQQVLENLEFVWSYFMKHAANKYK